MNAGANPLTRSLELTRAMLLAAQASDWELLTRFEAERHPLVMQPHAPTAASHQHLGEILVIDSQLSELVSRARDAVAEQWQRASGRAHAIAAYAG